MYIIEKEKLEKIKRIIYQFGGPTKINYNTKNRFFINHKLVETTTKIIEQKIQESRESVSELELFAIISLVDYAIQDMGIYEFFTCTGLNYLEDGVETLSYLKDKIFKD